ncbi:unnamed protein product [Linum tenue]|uniref:Uncharacterized protein n=1 Tax=Linum tenue TaxID=586396 RepID=A0AAV0LXU9_9ROSI|nr:unnamed protein product [Linum tenue]
MPDSLPEWIFDFMPSRGGYFIEARWEELVGEMPLKVCYPAIESCDPKNTRWSYHNGGSWPGNNLFLVFHLRNKV